MFLERGTRTEAIRFFFVWGYNNEPRPRYMNSSPIPWTSKRYGWEIAFQRENNVTVYFSFCDMNEK